jgi:hypothetical protein
MVQYGTQLTFLSKTWATSRRGPASPTHSLCGRLAWYNGPLQLSGGLFLHPLVQRGLHAPRDVVAQCPSGPSTTGYQWGQFFHR